ncbi:MAG TPA: sugar phosphate isomerase/epimerase family protein [Bryobacteraceae bacterium]|nr:sugar phosphate isomerase/epimerase family protein [Bryobacteraceae bacterium]
MKERISRRVLLTALPGARLALAKADIRVGCQANGWPLKAGDFPQLLSVLDAMRSLGYTGFECNVRFVQDRFGSAAAARTRIQKTGVRFIGAHMNMEQGRADSFTSVLEGLAALGAGFVVMSGAGLAANGKFEEGALREKAAKLDVLGKVCRKHGLRLTYHNHNPEFANGNAEIEGLAKLTNPEAVEFLMDAGHGYLGGGDPAGFLSLHARRIRGIHLKTYRGQEQVPLGQGDFGFERLAAAVKQTGWTGWLITEEGGGTKINTAAVGPDREYIRRIFGV